MSRHKPPTNCWHRPLPTDTELCSICLCPIKELGEGKLKQQHRRCTHTTWRKRIKSRKGWKMTTIARGTRLEFPPAPTAWHRPLDTDERVCSICSCPVNALGGSNVRQQHRRLPNKADGWQKRVKSPEGWLIEPVDTPDTKVRKRIRQAAAMAAGGMTQPAIAEALGISISRLEKQIQKNRNLYEGQLRKHGYSPPERIAQGTYATLVEAATLIASGGTRPTVAAVLNMPVNTLRTHMRRHRKIYQKELAKAKQQVKGIDARCQQLLAQVADRVGRGQPEIEVVRELGIGPGHLRLWRRHCPQIWTEAFDAAREEARKEAYAIVAKAVEAVRSGRPAVMPTLREFYLGVYIPLRLTTAAEGTFEEHAHAIYTLEKFAGKTVLVDELTDELVAGCMAWQIGCGRSPATANKTRAHLLALWRYAVRRKLITTLPDVEKLKEPKRVPRAWLTEELGRIFQAAGQVRGHIGPVPASRWWIAFLSVAYDTGLRVSALMALKWADLEGRYLHVPAEFQKQGADQVVPLSDDALKALEAIRVEEEKIFPWPFDQWGRSWPRLNRCLRSILQYAGLPHTPKDLFHKIRRTTASYIAAGGGNPTAQLGHSSEQVTKAYLDPRITGRHNYVHLLPRPALTKTETDATEEPERTATHE